MLASMPPEVTPLGYHHGWTPSPESLSGYRQHPSPYYSAVAPSQRIVAKVDLGSPSPSPPRPISHYQTQIDMIAAEASAAAAQSFRQSPHTSPLRVREVREESPPVVVPVAVPVPVPVAVPMGGPSPVVHHHHQAEMAVAQDTIHSIAAHSATKDMVQQDALVSLEAATEALRAELVASNAALLEERGACTVLQRTVVELEERLRHADPKANEVVILRDANADLQHRLTQATHDMFSEREDAKRESSRTKHLDDTIAMLERERNRLRDDNIRLQEEVSSLPQKDAEVRRLTQTLEYERKNRQSPTPPQNTTEEVRTTETIREVEKMIPCNHEEEMQKLRLQISGHEDELRRSDAIHARQCNDLIANIEEARAQRDSYVIEIDRLRAELERLQAIVDSVSGMGNDSLALRRERDFVNDDLRAAKLEIEKLKREIQRLKEGWNRSAIEDGMRGGETRQAFEDLRRAYEELLAKNDVYRRQLRQATIDFKELEEHTARVEGSLNTTAAAHGNSAGSLRQSNAGLQNVNNRIRQASNILTTAEGNMRRVVPVVPRQEKRVAQDVLRSIQQSVKVLGGSGSTRSPSGSPARRRL